MTAKTGDALFNSVNDNWRYEIDATDDSKLNLRTVSAGSDAYDPATQANRTFDVNADHLHQAPDELSDVNVANGTVQLYLDMHTYRRVDLQLILETTGSAGTITVTTHGASEYTAAGGDIPADEWVDIGTGAYGAASTVAGAGAKTVVLLSNTNEQTGGLKWVRITLVVAGG